MDVGPLAASTLNRKEELPRGLLVLICLDLVWPIVIFVRTLPPASHTSSKLVIRHHCCPVN